MVRGQLIDGECNSSFCLALALSFSSSASLHLVALAILPNMEAGHSQQVHATAWETFSINLPALHHWSNTLDFCRWRLSDMLDFFRLLFPPYQTSQLVQVAFLAPTTNAGGSEGVTRRASKMCQAAAAARHELHRTCNVIWRGISRYETGSDSSTIKCL